MTNPQTIKNIRYHHLTNRVDLRERYMEMLGRCALWGIGCWLAVEIVAGFYREVGQ